jgi:hypothetical protein
MKIQHLFEDANADVAANKTANEIASKFARWFMPKNEETPLQDVPGVQFVNMYEMRIAYFDAKLFGIDDPTLHIGFSWTKDGSPTEKRGLLVRARMSQGDPTAHFFVTAVLSKDSTNEVDVAYSMRWDSLIHELIHYLDFKRGFKGEQGVKRKKHGEDYYNDPLEFNAHFQQGLHEIMRQFTSQSSRVQMTVKNSLADFHVFDAWAKSSMPKSFYLYLTPENLKKFERRVYKLWMYLKNQPAAEQKAA